MITPIKPEDIEATKNLLINIELFKPEEIESMEELMNACSKNEQEANHNFLVFKDDNNQSIQGAVYYGPIYKSRNLKKDLRSCIT